MTEHKEVVFIGGWPKTVRYSRRIAMLRASDDASAPSTIETLERIFRTKGNMCTVHGLLEDPIIFMATVEGEEQLVFACPACSDPRLFAQWRDEGYPD